MLFKLTLCVLLVATKLNHTSSSADPPHVFVNEEAVAFKTLPLVCEVQAAPLFATTL